MQNLIKKIKNKMNKLKIKHFAVPIKKKRFIDVITLLTIRVWSSKKQTIHKSL